MQKQISSKTTSLAFGVLVILFATAFYTFAWTEPTGAPPTGNTSAPVDIGPVTQTKAGSFSVSGAALEAYNNDYFSTVAGSVGIGTASPGEKLEVTGNIKLSGSTPTYRLTNLAEPTDNADAATKGYVDAKLGGGGGGGGGLDFYQTTGTYNGADADTACASGYHMCLVDEIIGRPYNTSLNDSTDSNLDEYSWVDTNANGYSSIDGDCKNWSTPDLFYSYNPYTYNYGRTVKLMGSWNYNYSTCNTSLPVFCCENANSELGAEQGAATFAAAATYCRETMGGSWHLPSIEELLQYVDVNESANYLWTSSGASGSHISVKLSDGAIGSLSSGSRNFRCVR
jgi:hypothetical protein